MELQRTLEPLEEEEQIEILSKNTYYTAKAMIREMVLKKTIITPI